MQCYGKYSWTITINRHHNDLKFSQYFRKQSIANIDQSIFMLPTLKKIDKIHRNNWLHKMINRLPPIKIPILTNRGNILSIASKDQSIVPSKSSILACIEIIQSITWKDQSFSLFEILNFGLLRNVTWMVIMHEC